MLIVIMGVSGCGKTIVGEILAREIGGAFFDSDQFFTQDKVEKMRSGIALTDADRAGWLQTLNGFLAERVEEKIHTVLACSALRQSYRKFLSAGISPPPRFIFLKGTFGTIRSRMEARKDHYMPVSLLRSQFETLEEPRDAITIDIGPAPDEIVREIRSHLAV